MPLDVWLAFALASAVPLAIPGPTVMIVVSYALGRGRASGFATVPGVVLGDATAMTISLAGAGALLAASATLFTLLKLAGAAYLVWLGVSMWRAGAGKLELAAETGLTDRRADWRRMFWRTYVVTALNPKSIVFFVAFVPQFIDPGASASAQFAILEATFLTLAAVNVALWAMLAGEMRARFESPLRRRLLSRIGGGMLIGAGGLTALQTRL